MDYGKNYVCIQIFCNCLFIKTSFEFERKKKKNNIKKRKEKKKKEKKFENIIVKNIELL